MKKLFSRLQFKLAATYIVIIVAILALLNTYPLIASQQLLFQTKQGSLQSQAAIFTSSLGVIGTLTPENVAPVMELLDDGSLYRLLVTDASGRVLYDSRGESTARYALFYEVTRALKGYDVFQAGFSGSAMDSRAAAPIQYRGQTVGTVLLCERDEAQAALLYGIRATLRTISVISCALLLVLSYFFSRWYGHRVSELLSTMGGVRDGDFDRRAEVRGRDELAELAEAFNDLTDRIRENEELRRRFVADASHELKTPLASIQLLSDSILQTEDMPPSMQREFVSDIGQEAGRLGRITEQLLQLARSDYVNQEERPPALQLGPVVQETMRRLEPLARENDITMTASLQSDCRVRITEDALRQILFNLIENAIKYNRPRGRVTVSLSHSEQLVFLRVIDTGVGIPEADRERIFQRFYRVDKARSRAAGGTGLGLAIVQQAVELSGGRVYVTAGEDGGSCFTVELPRCREEETSCGESV